MKQILLLFFFGLTVTSTAFAQKRDWLRIKMKNADTVLVVSHLDTNIGMADSAGNVTPPPPLLVKGRPNYAIVKEQQVVHGPMLDTLIRILARPFRDRYIETAKCFMPHHAIFLIKNGRTSYVDVCFGCRGFETSKDMRQLNDFDNRRWRELEDYFRRLGFRYELVDE